MAPKKTSMARRARGWRSRSATFLVVASISLAATGARASDIALVGGTIIDVSRYGDSTRDLPDATLVIHDRRIAAIGPRHSVAIPAGARVVDVGGQFLIPGLIDGFAAQRTRGQAKAHLAMGVTTIVGLSDDRRGLLMDFEPEPHVKRLEAVNGYDISHLEPVPDSYGEIHRRGRRLAPAELAAYVDARAWDGNEVLLLLYPLDDEQVRAVVAAARRRGLVTIGELGHASYAAAAAAGVQAFVHLNRIASELAPPDLRRELANDPFPGNAGRLRRQFEEFLVGLNPDGASVSRYAEALAAQHAALMPTATLFVSGTRLDPHNPWHSEIAPLIDPHEIHLPLDRITGRLPVTPGESSAIAELMDRATSSLFAIQRTFVNAGNRYLAASGTTAFGVLPGDGMHWEMQLLTRFGLTPRQALAAATTNYSSSFGWTDRGELAAGRLADIVTLSSDPTKDIANTRSIVRVFLAGEELDRQGLLRAAP